jgi:hypothetical protein
MSKARTLRPDENYQIPRSKIWLTVMQTGESSFDILVDVQERRIVKMSGCFHANFPDSSKLPDTLSPSLGTDLFHHGVEFGSEDGFQLRIEFTEEDLSCWEESEDGGAMPRLGLLDIAVYTGASPNSTVLWWIEDFSPEGVLFVTPTSTRKKKQV